MLCQKYHYISCHHQGNDNGSFYLNQNSDCRNRQSLCKFFHKYKIILSKILSQIRHLYFLLHTASLSLTLITQGTIRASSFVENIPCFGSEYLRVSINSLILTLRLWQKFHQSMSNFSLVYFVSNRNTRQNWKLYSEHGCSIKKLALTVELLLCYYYLEYLVYASTNVGSMGMFSTFIH